MPLCSLSFCFIFSSLKWHFSALWGQCIHWCRSGLTNTRQRERLWFVPRCVRCCTGVSVRLRPCLAGLADVHDGNLPKVSEEEEKMPFLCTAGGETRLKHWAVLRTGRRMKCWKGLLAAPWGLAPHRTWRTVSMLIAMIAGDSGPGQGERLDIFLTAFQLHFYAGWPLEVELRQRYFNLFYLCDPKIFQGEVQAPLRTSCLAGCSVAKVNLPNKGGFLSHLRWALEIVSDLSSVCCDVTQPMLVLPWAVCWIKWPTVVPSYSWGPPGNHPTTSQSKSKTSVDNPRWRELSLAGDRKGEAHLRQLPSSGSWKSQAKTT